MMSKAKPAYIFLLLIAAVNVCAHAKKNEPRQEVVKFMKSVGLEKELEAPVRITVDDSGFLCIADTGSFIVQYLVATPEVASVPNIVIDSDVNIPPTVDKAVIVAHGWVDKGASDWPADIARAIAECTDPNEWVCAFFDWKGGAAVVSPVDAARYGKEIAGPRLAAAISALPNKFKHVHLIGHSAGSWTINSAAKLIAEKTSPQTLHLTFLDAYVPPFWKAADLADIKTSSGKPSIFAEHYFTKDFTLEVTQANLPNAFNVDITAIDPWFKEHEFPYRWYYASITGRYSRFDEKKSSLVISADGIQYGFKRSLEAGKDNFTKSLTLKKGPKPVKLRPEKKTFDLNFFKKR